MKTQTSPHANTTLLVEEVIGGYTIHTEIDYIAPVTTQAAYIEKAQSNIDELKEFLKMCDEAMNELKVLKKLV